MPDLWYWIQVAVGQMRPLQQAVRGVSVIACLHNALIKPAARVTLPLEPTLPPLGFNYLFSGYGVLVMGREITSHRVNGLNEALLINVLDQPGQGNACHEYQIIRDTHGNGDEYDQVELCNIKFQNGPILEAGVNGVSGEALLAIVEDRLIGFQSGQFACRENAVALTKIQEAMMWLQKRTRDRISRGVEGTNVK